MWTIIYISNTYKNAKRPDLNISVISIWIYYNLSTPNKLIWTFGYVFEAKEFFSQNLNNIGVTYRLVSWLCLPSHQERGHLETAPQFTVSCKGREARFFTAPTGNRTPGRCVAVHYGTNAPRKFHRRR